MLTFIQKEDFLALQLQDPYYEGRGGYFAEAIDMVKRIPGVDEFQPSDVLEIGPYRLPIVPGCDVMDNMSHGLPVTHKHDASETPWPIETGRYRLMIALQVWEHLGSKQREAWQEARRVADWAVVSVPYMWPESTGLDHAHIDLLTMDRWTRQKARLHQLILSPLAPLYRLVCLYDLKAEQRTDDACH